MRRLKMVAGLSVAIFALNLGWQVGASEVASLELREDLKDLSSQVGARIGMLTNKTDEDFRKEVLSRAKRYNIQLTPDEVTVLRRGEGFQASMYLAAAYSVPVEAPGISFHLYFHPESGTRPE